MSNTGESKSFFQPPPDGDIILRSSDQINFQVHSNLLSPVCPLLKDMIAATTSKDPIDMAESAETLSHFLQSLYPTSEPRPLNDCTVIEDCLRFARKYDIESFRDLIETRICTDKTSLILRYRNPYRIYQLGQEYSLPKAKRIALEHLTPGDEDFHQPSTLIKLASEHPQSADVIAVIGSQSARLRILVDVLFDFASEPMRLDDDARWTYFRCPACRRAVVEAGQPEGSIPPPSWVIGWSRHAFGVLMERLDLASPYRSRLFGLAVLADLWPQEDICNACLSYLGGDEDMQVIFAGWLKGIQRYLEQQLATLRPLYALSAPV